MHRVARVGAMRHRLSCNERRLHRGTINEFSGSGSFSRIEDTRSIQCGFENDRRVRPLSLSHKPVALQFVSAVGEEKMRSMHRRLCAVALLFICGTASAEVVAYHYTGAQGTPLAITDAQGNLTSTADYRPYAEKAIGQPASALGYTGHVEDADTDQRSVCAPRGKRHLPLCSAGV